MENGLLLFDHCCLFYLIYLCLYIVYFVERFVYSSVFDILLTRTQFQSNSNNKFQKWFMPQ